MKSNRIGVAGQESDHGDLNRLFRNFVFILGVRGSSECGEICPHPGKEKQYWRKAKVDMQSPFGEGRRNWGWGGGEEAEGRWWRGIGRDRVTISEVKAVKLRNQYDMNMCMGIMIYIFNSNIYYVRFYPSPWECKGE